MSGLNGTRVLLLDDMADEAMPIIRALSSHRISCVWFTGIVEELPPEDAPLPNVRLALLDIDLTGSGGTDKQLIAALVKTLSRLLPKEAIALSIVLWTKHPEWRDQFLEALVNAGGPLPIALVALNKNDFLDPGSGTFKVADLFRELAGHLAPTEPWNVLVEWENEAREASAEVVNALGELAQSSKPKPAGAVDVEAWQQSGTRSLAKIFSQLATEEVGENNIKDGIDLLQGAFAAVGPWLSDQTDAASHKLAEQRKAVGDGLAKVAEGEKLPSGAAAKVNSRLSLTKKPASRCWTGNVYELKDGDLKQALAALYPEAEFRKQFVRAITKGVSPVEPTEPQAVTARFAKLKEVDDGILSIVLVDVNPPCDHAQRKTESGRLLVGARLRASVYESKVKTPPSMWAFGPLHEPTKNEEYYLIVDLRRPLVVASNVLTAAGAPSYRLRQAVATELLSHVGGHGARPGVLRVRA